MLKASVADAELRLQEASEQCDALTFAAADLTAKSRVLEDKVPYHA